MTDEERLAEIELRWVTSREPQSPIALSWHADQDIPFLLEKLREAQAVIEKLLKTGDGMPVTQGMMVWVRSQLGVTLGHRVWEFDASGQLHTYGFTEKAENCYSTKRAAEAANPAETGE